MRKTIGWVVGWTLVIVVGLIFVYSVATDSWPDVSVPQNRGSLAVIIALGLIGIIMIRRSREEAAEGKAAAGTQLADRDQKARTTGPSAKEQLPAQNRPDQTGDARAEGEDVGGEMAQRAEPPRPAAENGTTEAQFDLNVLYPKAERVKSSRAAAERGDANAQFNLSVMYAKGDGVAQDKAEAAKWCRKAAEQGLAAAQLSLAVAYSVGDGVPKSPSVALEWYARAAGAYLAESKREDALICYDRVKEIDPESPMAKALHEKLYGG